LRRSFADSDTIEEEPSGRNKMHIADWMLCESDKRLR